MIQSTEDERAALAEFPHDAIAAKQFDVAASEAGQERPKDSCGPTVRMARGMIRGMAPLVAPALNRGQNQPARSVSTWISTAGCSLAPRRLCQ